MVFPATLTFNVSSYGHISTHRKHSMHPETVYSPPFFSYTSVTCVGQTLLQTPHLVHFSSVLCRRVSAIRLKGANVLNSAVNPPKGQILHQNRLNARAPTVIKTKTITLSEVT